MFTQYNPLKCEVIFFFLSIRTSRFSLVTFDKIKFKTWSKIFSGRFWVGHFHFLKIQNDSCQEIDLVMKFQYICCQTLNFMTYFNSGTICKMCFLMEFTSLLLMVFLEYFTNPVRETTIKKKKHRISTKHIKGKLS